MFDLDSLNELKFKIPFFSVIAIIAVIITFILIRNEVIRSSSIPLAFSEISQIELENKTNNIEFTLFYGLVNDACMKVFEAYNDSLKNKGSHVAFSRELETHTEITFKTHKRNLTIILTNLSDVADKCLPKLSNFIQLSKELETLNYNLYNSWDEDHDDVYHTEYYTETEYYTDSNGNSRSRQVTKSRQVYDYTIHTYTFHSQYGYEASKLLNQMNKLHELPEELKSAKVTHAEGEYALEKSWKNYKKNITYDDVTNTILNWNNRTYYNNNRKEIVDLQKYLVGVKGTYASSIPTSRSIKYRTYSHFDDGPEELQIMKSVYSHSSRLYTSINEVVVPILNIKEKSKELLNTINKYIVYNLERVDYKISKSEYKNKILNDTKAIYKSIFKINFLDSYFDGFVVLKVIIIWSIIMALFLKMTLE